MSGAKRRAHGEGAVYRRASDGLWVGSLNVGYVNGRRVRRTVYGKTRREALDALMHLRRASEQGQDMTAPSPTFGEWLDRWMTTKRGDGTRPSTLRSYEWLIESHVKPTLGAKRLDRLTPLDVRSLIDAKSQGSLSMTSVGHILRLIRNTLAEAERMDLVHRNVGLAVKMPRSSTPEIQALTVNDARSLLTAAKSHRHFALFASLMCLGLRRGEALGLAWSDVDLANGVVHVRRTLQRIDGSLHLVETKTRASNAAVPIPPGLVAILRQHRARQTAEKLALGPAWTAGDLVFASTTGSPLEPRNVSREWASVRQSAGLPNVRLHDLRHGYATILTALGVQPRVVMQMLRHAQISTSMNVYAHVSLDTQTDAAGALDRALFGPGG